MGLHYPPAKWSELDRGLAAAGPELGVDSAASCAARLVEAPLSEDQIEVLAAHLTIGETYFFRDQPIFRALEERVLPDLIVERRRTSRSLRIWSAGCCTGEEPYSLAMVLGRLLPDFEEWDVTLLATDINSRFLAKAARGEYREWSFRETPRGTRNACFTPSDGRRFRIRERYRKSVTFGFLNLVDDVYPSVLNNTNAMDLILCRNVLMYLAPGQIERIVGRLSRCLVEGGWLIVSAAEVPQDYFKAFERVPAGAATLFRKSSRARPRAILPVQQASPVRPRTPPPSPSSPAAKVTPAADPLAEAKALYSGGRGAEAFEKLRPLAIGPRGAEAALLLARWSANEARLDEALRWCDRAIEADRLDPACYFLRAAILQERSAPGEAIAAFQRALYLDSRFVMAHFAIATLLRKQGRETEAARHFQNAADLAARTPPGDVLPESEGLTAGQLSTLIASMRPRDASIGRT